jgi:hypothetical protein
MLEINKTVFIIAKRYYLHLILFIYKLGLTTGSLIVIKFNLI